MKLFASFLMCAVLLMYCDNPISDEEGENDKNYTLDTTVTVSLWDGHSEKGLYNTDYEYPDELNVRGARSACEYEGVYTIPKQFDLSKATSCTMTYITVKRQMYMASAYCVVEVSTSGGNWFSVSELKDKKPTATLEKVDLNLLCGENSVKIRFRVPEHCGAVGDFYADWPVTFWQVKDIKITME